MTEQRNYQLRKPKFTTFEFYRLIDTYVRAGEEVAGRPWRVAADALRRAIRRGEAGLLGPRSAEQLVTRPAPEYSHLMYGLLTPVPPAVAGGTPPLNNPPPGTQTAHPAPT